MIKLAAAVGVAGAALCATRATRRPTVVALGVTAASLPVLMRDAARSRDPQRLMLLLALQQLRVVGAVAHEHLTRRLYSRRDADAYFREGLRLARAFRRGRLELRRAERPGITGMRYFTAVVLLATGRSRTAAAIAFAWLAFCGLYCFYRAFCIAVPDGDARLYLALLAFTPTLVFFPSSISKQAWLLFSLGLASLGAALVLERQNAAGFLLVAAGLVCAFVVRPHIAAMFALAFAAAVVVRVRDERVLGAVAAGAVVLAVLAVRYLRSWGIERGGVGSLFRQAGSQSNWGGSAFTPAAPARLREIPAAIATVLFRPHPLEAQSARVRLAALESSLFFAFSIVRARSLVRAGRQAREHPYLVLAYSFTALFGIGYAWAANFGLLAQHRTQVLPFAFVPLAVRPS